MISSTARDLPDHREQVRLACERAGFAPHGMMEHLTAENANAIQVSLRMVEEADVYVGILAKRYGYTPDGHEISITEMEYNRAVELGKPILIFFNHEDHLFKEKDVETGAGAAKLEVFKTRVAKEFVADFFKSAEDLRACVIGALGKLANPKPAHSEADLKIALRSMARELADSERERVALAKALEETNAALKRAEANPPAGETAQSIECARQRLADGNKADAERIFQEIADTEERHGAEHNCKAAEAYRNLAALAYLDNTEKAARLYGKAIELDPEDGWSLYQLALLQMRMGNLAAAKSTAERLLALHNKIEDPRIVYLALLLLGEVARANGNIGNAKSYHQQALEKAQQRVDADAEDKTAQRDLSISHDRIGDVQRAQGDLAAALASYQASLAIRERLAASDPGNAEWQRDLFVSQNKIGDVQRTQGDLAAALASYQAGLAIRERLAASDLGNAEWQRDLSVSHDRIGNVQRAQGDLAAALASYEASLAIRERLAASDPGNAEWQRDLSVSHERIGDVQSAQGNLAAALSSYQAGLAIAERLAASDPGNAEWQRDLSVSHERIGDVQSAQGNLAAALSSYQAGLAIAERLAASDPGNAGWQADLAASYGKLGQLHRAMGDIAEAREQFEKGRAIVEPFAEKSGHQLWIGYLRSFDADLAALDEGS
jgi:tetratricopeptide (TPR) repeat protein